MQLEQIIPQVSQLGGVKLDPKTATQGLGLALAIGIGVTALPVAKAIFYAYCSRTKSRGLTMQQTFALVSVFLRMFAARPGPGVIIVVGIAGLTAIVVSLFTIASAFEGALSTTGKPDRALLLRLGPPLRSTAI